MVKVFLSNKRMKVNLSLLSFHLFSQIQLNVLAGHDIDILSKG